MASQRQYLNVAFDRNFFVVDVLDAAALHVVVAVVAVVVFAEAVFVVAEVLYEQWPRTFLFAVVDREAIGYELRNLSQLLDQSQARRVGGELE